jgi:hypothetical protein
MYKINHMINNEIVKIIVFYGKQYSSREVDLNALFIKTPTHKLFSHIFNTEELATIRKDKIKVSFTSQQIHFDDPIGVIKIKIQNELGKLVSLEEMYLFCLKEETIDLFKTYNLMTQQKRIELTHTRLSQFIRNLVRDTNGKRTDFPISKQSYSYQDLLDLNINHNTFWTSRVLGQSYFINDTEYPFVANPYDVESYDISVYEKVSRKSILNVNSKLLLDTGNIIGNNIYLCLAEDVLNATTLPEDITLKIYFPYLYLQQITSSNLLLENRPMILENNKNLVNNTDDLFDAVTMMYDIYKFKKTDLPYKSIGIKFIQTLIHSDYNKQIPIDTIFKLLHATQETPLIKFNSAKQENMYRLYADKISTDGRKIPYLNKATIFKLVKNVAKQKLTVAVYIEYKSHEIICEIDERCNTTISCKFENTETLDYVETLFQEAVNPILLQLKQYFQQHNYNILLFDTFTNDNIEIKHADFQINIPTKSPIDITPFKGCITSIFNIESTNISKGVNLRFKRVSNFNKRTSQEAFIIEQQHDGVPSGEILEALVSNYKLSETDAETLIQKIMNELQIEKGAKRKEKEIKINPGFKTTISFDKYNLISTIEVFHINQIHYLYILPIYIDTLIRLSQNKETTKVPSNTIAKLCGSKEKEDIVLNPIIKPYNQENIIEEEDDVDPIIHQDDIDKLKRMDFLFEMEDDDYDEEDENDEKNDMFGGKNTPPSSLSSLESVESNSNDSNPENTYSDTTPDVSPNSSADSDEVDLNVDGLKLKNPYYFQERIQTREPKLILTEKKGKYQAYSRICQSNNRRQPVILTKEEKDKIDKEYKGFLKEEDIISYGSNPDNQYYYICPRYWCLKTNSVISEADVKAGKCGKIIPADAKTVKPGHYVYEFYNPPVNNKQYKQYPGFQVDKHPDGYCLPCCFDKWNTKQHLDRRKKCSGTETETDTTSDIPKKPSTPPQMKEPDTYIKGPEKMPLGSNRWGYLPVAIQKILHEVNADCKISDTNANVKENYTCLLRHGVENNENQSFIACIADAIYFARETENKMPLPIPSISKMKQLISESITLDTFSQFQNGNLVADFKKEVIPNIDKYTTTQTYAKLNIHNKIELDFFHRIVASYENFLAFLQDDEVVIDYTYLWDIVCSPNKKLFAGGINLIIFEIVNNDITNNVELLCPTNHYSKTFYESRKPNLILIKQNNYFEPIYSYKKKGKKLYIGKTFSEYDPSLSKTLMAVLKKIIKPHIQNKCAPLSSIPETYTAKPPVLLMDVITILHKKGYTIIKQVVNYDNKVIGIVATFTIIKNNQRFSGFVPCYPSSIIPTYDYVYMIDKDIWNTYANTLEFLFLLASNSKLPMKPIFKVVEDEHIVGVLTETNQFVQLSEPFLLIESNDNLPVWNGSSETTLDIKIKDNKGDTERELYIDQIKLETKFYNVFRNTIRILLNSDEHIQLRETLESELAITTTLYQDKLEKVISLLIELTKNKIDFTENKKYYTKINKNDILPCIGNTPSGCKQNKMCSLLENNTCSLILPKVNLVTGKNNVDIYFGKMADEFIRFSRISSLILNQNAYISFENVDYNLRENEILIMQSLLTQEYFENLTAITENSFVKYNTRDTARPLRTIDYDNNIPTDRITSKQKDANCKTTEQKIKSTFWRKYFPTTYTELEYEKTGGCSFQFVIDMIQKTTGIVRTADEIRIDLEAEYLQYLPTYQNKIIDILIIEGKKTLGDQVRKNIISFKHFIFTDDYFITPLDIWILVEKYKIPTIFISAKFLLQTKYTKQIFVGYGSERDNHAFIFIPGLRPEEIPNYKLIQDQNKDPVISLSNLKQNATLNEIHTAFDAPFTIEEYLNQYTIVATTKYVRKNPNNQTTKKVYKHNKTQPVKRSHSPVLPVKSKTPPGNKSKTPSPKPKTRKKKGLVYKDKKTTRTKK